MALHTSDVLPDLLMPQLKLVFCGTAAGWKSAEKRAYYAGPGNKFWKMLHETGLTPRQLAPQEFPLLPESGIGLTDVMKTQSGMDVDLVADEDAAGRLHAALLEYQPRMLAFTSKKAASYYLQRPTQQIEYGLQQERAGQTQLFVLTSPSGAANPHWSAQPWQVLAATVMKMS
jgi:TDG/mug DNA glycosylase family protein